MSRFSSHTSSRGFTLLEAIVALVIIGVALIPVMSFLTNASRQLAIAADTTQRALTEQTLLAFAETINPLEKPTGDVEFTSKIRIRWVTDIIVPPSTQPMPGARAGDTKVGLYQINMSVIRDEKEWFVYPVRKMGFIFESIPTVGQPQ
jgi:prepilin-type N-terminal cleavage/methylation domain-containing protein